mgnify:CR=1 FL=1
MYINPGNQGFRELRTEDYVDKTGLISVVNRTLNGRRRLSCISRPRRFGKTYAACMLAAYYDASCDSAALFEGLQIAKNEDSAKYRNQFNVLYLDITSFLSEVEGREGLVPLIRRSVLLDIRDNYAEIYDEERSLPAMLQEIVRKDGRKFVAIIDEWDAPIRDSAATEESQKRYLEFLRGLFKSNITNEVFAGAYMTGILPIKKDGSQSAISEFKEYSILQPGPFAPYIGFTEEEVKGICQREEIPFDKMKEWYDGYSLRYGENEISIYNANSVMEAADRKEFQSYWRQSAAVNSLRDYINMDFDGLGSAAEKLLAGLEIPVKIQNFKNDLTSFESADDVLTLLIHFGYVTYEQEKEAIRIPNQEIQIEFADMIRKVTHRETMDRVRESDELLDSMVAGREEAVAQTMQKIHMEESAMRYYNNEQALRAVIKLALFTYRDHFIKMEELDTGVGYADIVYLPKKYENYPALIVELKYNDSADSGIAQIKQRNYPDVIKNYGGDILLVSISYDKQDLTKEHYCSIEKWSLEP